MIAGTSRWSSGLVTQRYSSADLLDHCRNAVKELGVAEQGEFVRAAAEDLSPIPDGSVDVVTTRSVLISPARGRCVPRVPPSATPRWARVDLRADQQLLPRRHERLLGVRCGGHSRGLGVPRFRRSIVRAIARHTPRATPVKRNARPTKASLKLIAFISERSAGTSRSAAIRFSVCSVYRAASR